MAEQGSDVTADTLKMLEQYAQDVSVAFAKAHAFTEHSFRQLEVRLDGRAAVVDERFDKIDRRLGRHELLLSEILNEVKALRR